MGPADRGFAARWRVREAWQGPLVTLLVVALTWLASATFLRDALPVRGALYALPLTAVVYAAFVGGLRFGLVSAVLGAAYAVQHYLALDAIFPAFMDRITLAGAVVVVTFVMAAITGHLSDRVQRALAKARETGAALAAANRSLVEANRALEAFTYLVSHDLKAPVRAVEARLRALEEDAAAEPDVPAVARDHLREARQANARLEHLLRGLLELSRTERLAREEMAPVSPSEVLASEDCRSYFEDALRERRGTIEVDVPANLTVVGDATALCQVFGNLVSNAVRHDPRAEPRVRVSASPAEAAVEFVVEDDGDGFPPTVVERFARGVVPLGGAGSGFGLVIARRSVERMGGTMTLGRSERLGGAAVRVRLCAGGDAGPGLADAAPGRPPPARDTGTLHA